MTVVAVDGHGAAGKSTLAHRLAERCNLSLVHTDDFFRSGRRAPAPSALEGYYELDRLADEALAPLREGAPAVFVGYDLATGATADCRVEPNRIVLLEGVCSSAPRLAGLVTRCVLVETPRRERLERLARLVAPEDWDDEWLAAEDAYFGRVRPATLFDLVLSGSSTSGSTL